MGGKPDLAAAGVLLEERPIVTFLYLLMSQDVPPGRVAELLKLTVDMPIGLAESFENEYLAGYAAEVADKLGAGRPSITVRRGTPVEEVPE